MGFILPELPDAPAAQRGFLSAAIFIGMLFGGLLCGMIADRLGRRPCLLLSLGITGAFGAPDVLENCVGFLRQHVKDTHAHAAALLVPKGSIGYPQVWQRKGGKKGWRFGDKDGLFVQVEAPGDRRLYFVPAGKAGAVATDWHPLGVDLFFVLTRLLGENRNPFWKCRAVIG